MIFCHARSADHLRRKGLGGPRIMVALIRTAARTWPISRESNGTGVLLPTQRRNDGLHRLNVAGSAMREANEARSSVRQHSKGSLQWTILVRSPSSGGREILCRCRTAMERRRRTGGRPMSERYEEDGSNRLEELSHCPESCPACGSDDLHSAAAMDGFRCIGSMTSLLMPAHSMSKGDRFALWALCLIVLVRVFWHG